MLIFSFFGQDCKVDNLATVRSIIWPHFLQKNWKMWPSYWPYSFHVFFVTTCFSSKISFSLQKEEDVWEKNNKNNKRLAKLLTYGGQVIDPTAYIKIYIYIYAVGSISAPLLPLCLVNWWSTFFYLIFLYLSSSAGRMRILKDKPSNNTKNKVSGQ